MALLETTLTRGAFVAGSWKDAGTWATVSAPYDGRVVGRVAVADDALVDQAIAAAHEAMTLTTFPAHERSAALAGLASAVEDQAEQFAQLITAEVGKPIRAARAEVTRAVATLTLSGIEATQLGSETIQMDATATGVGHVAYTMRVPIGVVGAITPFNFPLNLAAHKIGPALAAGCAVVLKPADKAPLSACLLADLAAEAGVPPGWLNVVVGDAESIASRFADDDRVGLITFTGSSSVGWRLRARAPRKPVSLELGNATPVVVDETQDPTRIASELALSAFASSGQSCISTQRVYAHESLSEELAQLLADEARAVAAGDPRLDSTTVGPLVTATACDRVAALVDKAVTGGARLLAGGEREGQTFLPTVLADAPEGSEVLQREVFGPVVSVQGYQQFDAALDACNATEFGLQAAVYTARIDRALGAVKRLEFGAVLVNEVPTFRADQMPYGGSKASGNTREGPAYAIREMTEKRLVVLRELPVETNKGSDGDAAG